jgi:hypothetical protein
MRLAIMQPYFFPYIGYFQLMATVDRFVVYDDVNFIRQGWINRNRMLCDGRPVYFTVPVQDASSFRLIHETLVADRAQWMARMLKSIRQNYSKAAFFDDAFALFQSVVASDAADFATLSRRSIEAVAKYIGLETEIVSSSRRYDNRQLSGQDRVIDICCQERCGTYVNMIGGASLYDPEAFAARGVRLEFLEPRPFEYRQLGSPFVPWLSIVDVLMFNPPEDVHRAVAACELT